MILHERPAAPANFPPLAIQQTKQALVAQNGAGEFPDHWGKAEYKAAFARAQHHKCGWCDAALVNSPGHMDHIAPKAARWEIGQPGAEVPDLLNVHGRARQGPGTTGYWWRAYDWENWVYTCERCNSAWKSAYYPLAEGPNFVPSQEAPGTPLLLSPFGPLDPAEHLTYDEFGQIRPKGGSRYGRATIDVCGLDRESLRRCRQSQRDDAARALESYIRWLTLLDEQPLYADIFSANLAKDLESLSKLLDDSHPFAGLCRDLIAPLLEAAPSP